MALKIDFYTPVWAIRRCHRWITSRMRKIALDTNGAIATISALVLPIMLGFAALSLEYGTALVTKTHNQRTSDLSAYAAAFEFRKTPGEVAEKVAAARIAANAVAGFNGVSSGVTVSFDDPSDPTWVQVSITENQMVFLSRLIRPDESLDIGTAARVSLGEPGGVIPCILSTGTANGTGFTANGNSGTYNVTGCGIGANNEIAVNGQTISAECAATSFKKSGACTEESQTDGFADPIAELTNWPINPNDDAVCDFTGSLLEDLAVQVGGNKNNGDYQLKDGVLCVDEVSTNFSSIFSDPAGSGSTLIFASGINLTISGGNKSLTIAAPTSGAFQGVAYYAPNSDLTVSGNADFILSRLSCFGLVSRSMTFNGNVTLSAQCDAEDSTLTAGLSSLEGRPRLIQ